ncbi:MAG: ZIP family metal transporter [Gemmatimonadetes bacterium]|nr:ZIP family metal transporter [Gemmatimonadota bacterium]NIO30500.1 ZIP family metal transporter [Gemmatimonadota bacterium]
MALIATVHLVAVLNESNGAAPPAAAIGFALLTALGMLVGVWTVRRFEPWAVRHTAELIAFAAGLLVCGALLHLLPRAAHLVGAEIGLVWALVAFIVFYLVEAHFIPHVHARGESPLEEHPHDHDLQAVGPLVVVGLAIHSIVDGVSIGAGLTAGALIGSVTAMLVIAHKLPVGIAAMSALYHSGVPGQRAALVTTALAMVTPLAVLVSYFTFRGISAELLGILLSLAGGSFLYIGAADLLPEGQAHGRPTNTLMFLLGALVMVAIKFAAH